MKVNTCQPLEGLKVLELTHMVMGPACGLVLADLGADVIKVEPPGGDPTRRLPGSGAGYFPMYNRNKRSICLNLKSPEGKEAALKLADRSDVLIQNFRPGAMQRLGLDYEPLSARNPRLIYCTEKGFQAGPYESRAALDEVAQMMGGLAYMTGPPGKPLRAGASVIDVQGGMFGALGILAALHERERTGRGCEVVATLYESAVFLVGQHMAQKAVTGTAASADAGAGIGLGGLRRVRHQERRAGVRGRGQRRSMGAFLRGVRAERLRRRPQSQEERRPGG